MKLSLKLGKRLTRNLSSMLIKMGVKKAQPKEPLWKQLLAPAVGLVGVSAGLAVAWRRREQLRAAADKPLSLLQSAWNWIKGLFGRVKEEEIPDVTLIARVRAELERLVANPADITVMAHNGKITLFGYVDDEKRPALVAGIKAVPGVKAVDDELETEPKDELEGLPAEENQKVRSYS